MAANQKQALKFTLFLLGVGASAGAFWLWRRCSACQKREHTERRDRLQEIAVEDSFPASDPPASW